MNTPDWTDKRICCYCKKYATCTNYYGCSGCKHKDKCNVTATMKGIDCAKFCDEYEFNKRTYRNSIKTPEEEKLVVAEYDKSQCVYGPDSTMPCILCSATCKERMRDFIKRGRKSLTDEKTGITVWI